MRSRWSVILGALAITAACYHFDQDLADCQAPGGPCNAFGSGDAGPDGGDAGSLQDSGVPDGGPAVVSVCTANAQCQSGVCNSGCCDSSCAGVAQLAGGDGFTCARTTANTVRCWGNNDKFQTAQASGALVLLPADVPGLTDVVDVAAGADFACAVISDGTVKCWGNNASGQLGHPTAGPTGTPSLVPGVSGATRVTAGADHACALLGTGHLQCWGSNDYGQLGNSASTTPAPAGPVCTSGAGASCLQLGGVSQVSAGSQLTCARVLESNVDAVYCWGDAQNDELGPSAPSGNSTSVPTKVPLPTPVKQIVAGPGRVCAVAAGQALCWGGNRDGMDRDMLLGRGDAGIGTVMSPNPAPVCTNIADGGCVPLSGVDELDLGGTTGCARTAGSVWCWGDNYLVKLGTARAIAYSDVAIPADALSQGVPVLQSSVRGLELGVSQGCAVTSTFGAYCWGGDVTGELGNNQSGWNADNGPSRPIW